MRLLIDANLSPRLLAPLRNEGFDTTHVADIGLATAEVLTSVPATTGPECPMS